MAGPRHGRPWRLVKSRKGQLLGNGDLFIANGPKRSPGQQTTTGKNGIGRIAAFKKPADRGMPIRFPGWQINDQLLLRDDPGICKGHIEAAPAIPTGDTVDTEQTGDPLITMLEHMTGQLLGGGHIIDNNAVHDRAGYFPVDDHHGTDIGQLLGKMIR